MLAKVTNEDFPRTVNMCPRLAGYGVYGNIGETARVALQIILSVQKGNNTMVSWAN